MVRQVTRTGLCVCSSARQQCMYASLTAPLLAVYPLLMPGQPCLQLGRASSSDDISELYAAE
jgi:hypothetical protein